MIKTEEELKSNESKYEIILKEIQEIKKNILDGEEENYTICIKINKLMEILEEINNKNYQVN